MLGESTEETTIAISNETAEQDANSGTLAPRIAVLIPCYNEELTIGNVVRSFRAELPTAEIYVYDNNSSDHTIAVAQRRRGHLPTGRKAGKRQRGATHVR